MDRAFAEVKQVLQTLAPNESYHPTELAFDQDRGQSINFAHYFDILKRRIFYFLVPFGLFSVFGLYWAANVTPSYLSEGKILAQTQRIATDLVRPVITATPIERVQVIRQRFLTRDNLLSIAAKFGLFSERPGIKPYQILELMRISTHLDFDVQTRQGDLNAIALTIGFEYSNPETAVRVANEFVTLIIDEDSRSRTGRATETVKVLTSETKSSEDQLESNQAELLEIARRPRDSAPGNF